MTKNKESLKYIIHNFNPILNLGSNHKTIKIKMIIIFNKNPIHNP